MDLEYEQMGDYLIPKLKANPEPEGNGNEIRTLRDKFLRRDTMGREQQCF